MNFNLAKCTSIHTHLGNFTEPVRHNYSTDPTIVEIGPTNVEIGPHNVEIGPTNVGIGPTNVGIGPTYVGIGPTNVGIGLTIIGIISNVFKSRFNYSWSSLITTKISPKHSKFITTVYSCLAETGYQSKHHTMYKACSWCPDLLLSGKINLLSQISIQLAPVTLLLG